MKKRGWLISSGLVLLGLALVVTVWLTSPTMQLMGDSDVVNAKGFVPSESRTEPLDTDPLESYIEVGIVVAPNVVAEAKTTETAEATPAVAGEATPIAPADAAPMVDEESVTAMDEENEPANEDPGSNTQIFRLCGGPDDEQTARKIERAIKDCNSGNCNLSMSLVTRSDGCAELTLTTTPKRTGALGGANVNLTSSMSVNASSATGTGGQNRITVRIVTRNGEPFVEITDRAVKATPSALLDDVLEQTLDETLEEWRDNRRQFWSPREN